MPARESLFQVLQSYLLFRETITVDPKECETCKFSPCNCHYLNNEENLSPLISRKDGSCSMRKPALEKRGAKGVDKKHIRMAIGVAIIALSLGVTVLFGEPVFYFMVVPLIAGLIMCIYNIAPQLK